MMKFNKFMDVICLCPWSVVFAGVIYGAYHGEEASHIVSAVATGTLIVRYVCDILKED